ncbi:MAG: hypothetical protein E5V63_21960, partial [Mesorhizobium sp.]
SRSKKTAEAAEAVVAETVAEAVPEATIETPPAPVEAAPAAPSEDEPARPTRRKPASTNAPAVPVVSSSVADETKTEDKPKRAGWWQRKGFF